MSESENNRFTEQDVRTALQAYRTGANNYPRDLISKLSGITIPENKRNYRKQKEHMKIISAIRDIVKPNWRDGNGRPSKEQLVKKWKLDNPHGKKIDCHRDTAVSYTHLDVYKRQEIQG